MTEACKACKQWYCDATCPFWRYRNPNEARSLDEALAMISKRVKPLTPNQGAPS